MADMVKVETASQIEDVAGLARTIWTQHYVPIIGQEQVDYMLCMFQSAPAIASQIANGYIYYLVCEAHRATGYFALVPNKRDASLLLSKIYILPSCQGRGLGKEVIAFCEQLCLADGFRTLWLTVNKHNANSIAFYRSRGFSNETSIVTDIGKGFVMDDYKMVKRLTPTENG